MMWMATPAAVALWVTAGLALVVSWIALRHDPFPGSKVFPYLMLAVAEWALFAGLEAATVPLRGKIGFSQIEYIGFAATPVLFLIFSARHSGYDRWIRSGRRIALWLPAVAVVGLAATNELHHWLWAKYLPGPSGYNSTVFVHGPAYYAVAAWVYLLVLAGCILVARSAIRHSGLRRRQAITILVASLFPFAVGILYVVDVTLVPGLDLIPVSFLLTGLVFLLGISYFRVFDLVPVARNALIEQAADAVLVADANGCIVDANPTAIRWFAESPANTGRDIAQLFAPWPKLHAACTLDHPSRVEVTLSADPLRHVDAHVTPVREPRGHPAGCFIVLRDITERYRNELDLQRANAQLAKHVREIEALHDELRERAIRDGLTGLFNRRYLDEVLPRELGRASHGGDILSIAMIDIDHFKEINDRFGHREGDRLLALLGRVLREETRPRDTACRYGGEEFLLVLPLASPQVARDRVETVRAAYATLLQAEGFAAPPTLSAGIATFPMHGQSDDALLRAADEALYYAKATGRDRVCIAVVPTTRGPSPISKGPRPASYASSAGYGNT